MWYRGGWANTGVGFATSTDGVTWSKYPKNPIYGCFENNGTTCNDGGQPWVVKVSSGGYRIYTTNNQQPSPHLNMATSPDGIHWTTYQGGSVVLPTKSDGALWGNRVVWEEEGSTMW